MEVDIPIEMPSIEKMMSEKLNEASPLQANSKESDDLEYSQSLYKTTPAV